MSRIGKKPIPLVSGVKAECKGSKLKVSGPKGTLELEVAPQIAMKVEDGAIVFDRKEESRSNRALHGLYRSLAANMCEGVATGFTKSLEVSGTGYAVKLEGKNLVLLVGFCHPVKMPIPAGLTITCPTATTMQVSGIDKQLVGDFSARVRKVRPPEPYKGKGIKYVGEVIRRKAGKTLAGK